MELSNLAQHLGGSAIRAMYNEALKMKDTISFTVGEPDFITPKPIIKNEENSILAYLDISRRLNSEQLEEVYEKSYDLPLEKIPNLIEQLEAKMKDAAKTLEFEEAAKYRDRILKLRDRLLGRSKFPK